MHVVEIRLRPSELSMQMGAMRIWLDEYRFEPSSFACSEGSSGVVVSLEFKSGRRAEEFAKRFGGRADGTLTAGPEQEAAGEILETGLSPSGIVG